MGDNERGREGQEAIAWWGTDPYDGSDPFEAGLLSLEEEEEGCRIEDEAADLLFHAKTTSHPHFPVNSESDHVQFADSGIAKQFSTPCVSDEGIPIHREEEPDVEGRREKEEEEGRYEEEEVCEPLFTEETETHIHEEDVAFEDVSNAKRSAPEERGTPESNAQTQVTITEKEKEKERERERERESDAEKETETEDFSESTGDQHASSSSFLPSSHQITQEIPKVQSPSLPERGVKRRAERQENRHEVHKRTGKKNDKKEPKKTTESEAMSPVKAPVLPSSAPAPLTSVFPDFGGTLGRQEIASRPLPFFPRPLSGVQSSFRSPVVPPMEYPPPFLVQAGMRLLASHLKAGIGPMPAENGRHPTTGPFETTASSVPTTRTGRTDRVPSSASRTDHVPSSTRQRRTGELECASRPLESTRAYLDARYNVVMAKEERRALKKAKTMFFQRPSMDTKQLRMRWGKEAQIGFLAAVVCSVLTTVSKGNGFRCLRWDALPRLLELQPDDGNIFITKPFVAMFGLLSTVFDGQISVASIRHRGERTVNGVNLKQIVGTARGSGNYRVRWDAVVELMYMMGCRLSRVGHVTFFFTKEDSVVNGEIVRRLKNRPRQNEAVGNGMEGADRYRLPQEECEGYVPSQTPVPARKPSLRGTCAFTIDGKRRCRMEDFSQAFPVLFANLCVHGK